MRITEICQLPVNEDTSWHIDQTLLCFATADSSTLFRGSDVWICDHLGLMWFGATFCKDINLTWSSVWLQRKQVHWWFMTAWSCKVICIMMQTNTKLQLHWMSFLGKCVNMSCRWNHTMYISPMLNRYACPEHAAYFWSPCEWLCSQTLLGACRVVTPSCQPSSNEWFD